MYMMNNGQVMMIYMMMNNDFCWEWLQYHDNNDEIMGIYIYGNRILVVFDFNNGNIYDDSTKMLFHGNGYWLYLVFNSAKLLGSQSLRYKKENISGFV